MIAKRRDSPYERRRSKHWLKMKCEASQNFVVGGFTDPSGSRVGLGALLGGHFDDGHVEVAEEALPHLAEEGVGQDAIRSGHGAHLRSCGFGGPEAKVRPLVRP